MLSSDFHEGYLLDTFPDIKTVVYTPFSISFYTHSLHDKFTRLMTRDDTFDFSGINIHMNEGLWRPKKHLGCL